MLFVLKFLKTIASYFFSRIKSFALSIKEIHTDMLISTLYGFKSHTWKKHSLSSGSELIEDFSSKHALEMQYR